MSLAAVRVSSTRGRPVRAARHRTRLVLPDPEGPTTMPIHPLEAALRRAMVSHIDSTNTLTNTSIILSYIIDQALTNG